MKAILRFHSKVTLIHSGSGDPAIAELKVWEVPRSDHYPEGLKYSMFLVRSGDGQIIVGLDNHRPKGPHAHVGREERPYRFEGTDKLVEDFWRIVELEGYET